MRRLRVGAAAWNDFTSQSCDTGLAYSLAEVPCLEAAGPRPHHRARQRHRPELKERLQQQVLDRPHDVVLLAEHAVALEPPSDPRRAPA